jgi:site-specific DNA-cytosine methylase
VAATGIPTRDLYMLAGNSIPIPVLEAIFKELLLKKE